MAVRFPVDSPKTVLLPSWLITEAGSLEVEFYNTPPEGAFSPITTSVTIGMSDVRLLYRVGGFGANYVRAMILVWLLQAFLAALAVMTASWLSFPVACLWCNVLYTIGLMAGFVIDSTAAAPGSGTVVTIGRYLSKAVLLLLPNLARVNPSDALVGGLLISWRHMTTTALLFMLWSFVPLVVAAVIFTHRELARVIAE
jgi:hypothetical protein